MRALGQSRLLLLLLLMLLMLLLVQQVDALRGQRNHPAGRQHPRRLVPN